MGKVDSIIGVVEGVGPGKPVVIRLLTSVLPEKKIIIMFMLIECKLKNFNFRTIFW